jgi:hypothetical protein
LSHDESTFEETLDRLEGERDAIEVEYRKKLTALDECVQGFAAAIEEVGRAARAREEAREQIAARVEARLGAGAAPGSEDRWAPPPWPAGGGPLRRLVNGLMRRLMRDYLDVIDRRTDQLNERLDLIQGVFGDLLAATGGSARAEEATGDDHASSGAGDLSTTAAAHAAFTSAADALAAAVEVHREAHRVVNAKDAEVLQRAAAGPLRRMELVFDEFARQQEALLAQLVGRRQELDDLIAGVKQSPRRE